MSPTDVVGPTRVKEMLERALSFTEKLLAENARLRRALAATHAGSGSDGARLHARVVELEGQLAATRADLDRRVADAGGATPAPAEDARRISELEGALAEERERHRRLEEQNNSLANLYVASFQLHSTLDFKEVVSIVMEIVVNLVGAEAFALMLVDGRTDRLHVVAAEGFEPAFAPMPVGHGVIGQAVKSGEAWFAPVAPQGDPDPEAPLAVIPLRIKDLVIGALVVWRLLPQKRDGFSALDHELFQLLAGHAATAIFSSKLYGESERKLSTIQGFLDLLTNT